MRWFQSRQITAHVRLRLYSGTIWLNCPVSTELQRTCFKVYVSCIFAVPLGFQNQYCTKSMALNICILLGALYVLPGRYVAAQSTTTLLPPHGNTESWIVDDAQAFASTQTASSPESTQNLDMADRTLSIHLKVPIPTLADSGVEELATTVPILSTQTEMLLPSNASDIEASKTASSSLSQPSLPAVTVAEFNPSENTTDIHTSTPRLSTSIMTIKQQSTTVYVAQITPTTSQTLEPVPTESESFLESSGITTPGSKANIAAVGLGAGCGVLVLVVFLAVAMWLLHRHRGRRRRAERRDSIVKLERQSDY